MVTCFGSRSRPSWFAASSTKFEFLSKNGLVHLRVCQPVLYLWGCFLPLQPLRLRPSLQILAKLSVSTSVLHQEAENLNRMKRTALLYLCAAITCLSGCKNQSATNAAGQGANAPQAAAVPTAKPSAAIPDEKAGLYPARIKGLYGFIDKSGAVVL